MTDETSLLALKKFQEGKLKELQIEDALKVLQSRAEKCHLTHLHLLEFKALTGEASLYDTCVEMEAYTKEKLLVSHEKLPSTVRAAKVRWPRAFLSSYMLSELNKSWWTSYELRRGSNSVSLSLSST